MESSVSLNGEIPSPIDLPRGCFLASRCPFVIDQCRSEMPPARRSAPATPSTASATTKSRRRRRRPRPLRLLLPSGAHSAAAGPSTSPLHPPALRKGIDMPGSLEGKTALVTGGARGIGGAIARAFVREGAAVAMLDRQLAPAKATADTRGKGAKVSRSLPTSATKLRLKARSKPRRRGSATSTSSSTMRASTRHRWWRTCPPRCGMR